ncbi:dienelactone hydrolase family protein [Arthrobacter sp. NA-172]|uniref:dienelactone hydrolase family protein n=1 Tax=Arthrobacter sp. NA-172 TaxID=3367524 RepID=UPI003753EE77
MVHIDLSAESAAAGGSRTLQGYLAVPTGGSTGAGPFPGVVLVHEAFGLDDVMRGHADRLASAGYLTLAVDLYSDGGARRCLVATMRSLMSGAGRAFTDLSTARSMAPRRCQVFGKNRGHRVLHGRRICPARGP